MVRTVRSLAIGALTLGMFVFPAFGDEPACVDCGSNSTRFPEAAQLLEGWGLAPDAFTILLVWQERARNGSGTIVTGMRLAPVDGAVPFDVYADRGGTLLTPGELAALQIPPKKWDFSPAERPAESGLAVDKFQVPRPIAKSAGLLKPAASRVRLAPLDLEALAREDAARDVFEKGAKRIGAFQDLPAPVRVDGTSASAGVWQALDGGEWAWTCTLSAPGAIGQRVRFSELILPPAGAVVVYNPGDPAEAYGPYTGFQAGDADLWSATCFSEEVVVECTVAADADRNAVALEIDRIVNIYTALENLPWAKAAGTCNLDVSCYPEWSLIAKGVGGIGTFGQAGYLWCTGTLLADTDPATSIPYFLTANHCVNTQSGLYGASSIEVYWLYQTSTCNGVAPRPKTVPRTTGGADLLAGTSLDLGTDFTLLRLRNAPPAPVTYVGWSNTVQPAGVPVTTIHHPSGDYKRISFGEKTGDDGAYHRVIWNAGTTEPGSSGSPLLVDGLVVGQLYGGLASCSVPMGEDVYGRFDLTYPIVHTWLASVFSPWDVDRSGRVNSIDVQLAVDGALLRPVAYDVDVNDSGRVDAVDIQLIVVAALNEVYP